MAVNEAVTVPAPAAKDERSVEERHSASALLIGQTLGRLEEKVDTALANDTRIEAQNTKILYEQAHAKDVAARQASELVTVREIATAVGERVTKLEKTESERPPPMPAPPLAAPRPASFTNEVREELANQHESIRAVAMQQKTVAQQQQTVAEQQKTALDAATLAAERAQKNFDAQERTKRIQILVPVLGVLLTVAGTVIVTLISSANNRAALQEMEARQAGRTSALSAALSARPVQTLPPYLIEVPEPAAPAPVAPGTGTAPAKK